MREKQEEEGWATMKVWEQGVNDGFQAHSWEQIYNENT